jgi:hypothetical protein
MAIQLRDLLDQLRPDPWRKQTGFSLEMNNTNEELFRLEDADRRANLLNDWIAEYQPCLFGRIAAKLGLISYCLLDEQDLQESDEFVRDRIQQARLNWLQKGLRGEQSAFVIAAISKRITNAVPDESVKRIALRLCEMYLLQTVEVDQIYLDSIELEIPGQEIRRWRWGVE